MLDEMDAVFGVSALLAEEQREARAQAYEARALQGLRVAHDLDAVRHPPRPAPHRWDPASTAHVHRSARSARRC